MPLTKKKKIDPEVASALLTLSDRLNKLEKNQRRLKEQTHPAPFFPGETVKFGTRQAVVEECTPKMAKIRLVRDYGYSTEYHYVDPQFLSAVE